VAFFVHGVEYPLYAYWFTQFLLENGENLYVSFTLIPYQFISYHPIAKQPVFEAECGGDGLQSLSNFGMLSLDVHFHF
jgi:hypothetical protein